MKPLHALLALCLSCILIPVTAIAQQSDLETATKLRELELLAIQGDVKAQGLLGWWYYIGHGVTKNYKVASRMYRLAAAQGDAVSQILLGEMYYKGEGVPQDYKEAMRLYRLAATQGDAKAQILLGEMYYKGEGVPQDYKEAMRLYRLAAAQGLSFPQFLLGEMYRRGEGVTQSRVIAYALYNLSAADDSSGGSDATANRASLSKSMSTKEIEFAQDLTRELAKPKNLLKVLDQYAKNPTVKE